MENMGFFEKPKEDEKLEKKNMENQKKNMDFFEIPKEDKKLEAKKLEDQKKLLQKKKRNALSDLELRFSLEQFDHNLAQKKEQWPVLDKKKLKKSWPKEREKS